jgi:hypothetical protein
MVFPRVAGIRKRPRYSAQEVAPEKTLIKTSAEPAIQCASPAAGIRRTSNQVKNIWEMVS